MAVSLSCHAVKRSPGNIVIVASNEILLGTWSSAGKGAAPCRLLRNGNACPPKRSGHCTAENTTSIATNVNRIDGEIIHLSEGTDTSYHFAYLPSIAHLVMDTDA
ncbi:hypothetical protein CEXT_331191 [Caerostris extrusa]|uniref:Uncharacterized protein n=1 Tax=Caerostris extrusa TaxID=172846 RepID=A0AAV4QP55_CAEEX|nr:hypothetical protein CEXT_331191 [Caerostris extrusa]